MASPQTAPWSTTDGLGPFAEQLLDELEKTTVFDGFKIDFRRVELGGTQMEQTVSIDFHVTRDDEDDSDIQLGTNVHRKEVDGGYVFTSVKGPSMTFSFLPVGSIANNIEAFKAFVRERYYAATFAIRRV